MARFLFAAHDPGGAQMIGAALGAARASGHSVDFIAAGPTVALWRAAGHQVIELPPDGDIAAAAEKLASMPDAVIAGTGFGPFERNCWRWARDQGIPALAAVDAWTNITRRFETPSGLDFPNAVAVVDEAAGEEVSLAAEGRTAVAIVGQPHLQAQTAQLAAARKTHERDPQRPALVFFSEPVIEDFAPGTRGFDQFSVFEALIDALVGASSDWTLAVKPHPREATQRWRATVDACQARTASNIALSEATALDLLAEADAVFGMTSMTMLEAHLAGVPILSLQPDRSIVVNPMIDEICQPVTAAADVANRVAGFIAGGNAPALPGGRFRAILRRADKRMVAAMESLLEY